MIMIMIFITIIIIIIIAPPPEALFFIKSPTLSPVPGALQHANGYDLRINEPSESHIK